MLEKRAKGARSDCDRLVKAEIEHYTKIFLGEREPDQAQVGRGTLFQPVPPAWIEMERRAARLIRQQTGSDVTEHALRRLHRAPGDVHSRWTEPDMELRREQPERAGGPTA